MEVLFMYWRELALLVGFVAYIVRVEMKGMSNEARIAKVEDKQEKQNDKLDRIENKIDTLTAYLKGAGVINGKKE